MASLSPQGACLRPGTPHICRRRRRAQPARYGEWVQVQDTPRPDACSAGREQEEGVEEDVDGICKAGERLDKEVRVVRLGFLLPLVLLLLCPPPPSS